MTHGNTPAAVVAAPITPSHGSALDQAEAKSSAAAGIVLRYGLVAILLYYGYFKFFAFEAKAIQPLVSNSPFMGWIYNFLSVQATSNLIGAAEILIAVGLALRPVAPKITALASLGAVGMTLSTLSFLFSTPGVWTAEPGVPLPVTGGTGGFLIKDVFLLGAALWSLGESLRAASKPRLP